jgi:hypothetical protein
MSMPIDTPHHPHAPPLPCSQSLVERTWSQRSSRSRRGPEGQLHAAITKVRRLWLEPTPECSPSCQRPLTRLLSHHPHPTPHSLGDYNKIGDQGASALAAILKETQITNLKCAAARVFAFMSMPIDTPTLSPSPLHPSLAVSEAAASDTRAPLRSPPSSRRHRSLT